MADGAGVDPSHRYDAVGCGGEECLVGGVGVRRAGFSSSMNGMPNRSANSPMTFRVTPWSMAESPAVLILPSVTMKKLEPMLSVRLPRASVRTGKASGSISVASNSASTKLRPAVVLDLRVKGV